MTTRYFEADVAWFGVDRLGQIAAFITAGSAPIPRELLNRADLDLATLEQVANRLPKIGEGLLVERSGDMSSFVSLAERGFFVFDWSDVHRTRLEHINAYERVCAPTIALSVGLVDRIQLAAIQFESIIFGNSKKVSIHEFVECVWPVDSGYE
jgi:hypothetical protein